MRRFIGASFEKWWLRADVRLTKDRIVAPRRATSRRSLRIKRCRARSVQFVSVRKLKIQQRITLSTSSRAAPCGRKFKKRNELRLSRGSHIAWSQSGISAETTVLDPPRRHAMSLRNHFISCALAGITASLALPVHARDANLLADSGWKTFDVDRDAVGSSVWADIANNSFERLFFTFTVASGFTASLTVLDGAFAGNTFAVFDGNIPLGNTNAVTAADQDTAGFASSYDAALLDNAYSRGVFTFGAGAHRVNGTLLQAGLASGTPVFATEGAVRLTSQAVTPVPEPSTYATLLAGLLMSAFVLRRIGR